MRSGINEINKVLKQDHKILSVFTTAGFPNFDDTVRVCLALAATKVGFIELGIPFSDPIADGETIQRTSDVALKNGMTLEKIFPQVVDIRKESNIPILLMGYFNPIFQYGVDRFVESCVKSGVDGVIVPDLPRDEYLKTWQAKLSNSNLSFVFLVTPQTSEERIREIDELSTSFIYAVSSAGVTGGAANKSKQEDFYKYLDSLKLRHPVMIGFGIRDKETFDLATKYQKGAIIGSEFLRKIEGASDIADEIGRFVSCVFPD